MRSTKSRRSGVTILEVLIAMGIALFGLLAVMAIVPYAAHQARAGLAIEDAAKLGQRALSEFHVHDMGNPNNWITTNSAGFPNRYTNFDHFLESPGAPADPATRFFHDEAILIDPQFYFANGGTISHFPYCYAPQTFVDAETTASGNFREPLLATAVPQSFMHFLDGNGDPTETIAPYVRRVGLANTVTTPLLPFLPMPLVQAREIFETSDDLSLQPLGELQKTQAPEVEDLQRLEYFQAVDGSGIKPLAQGATSWLPMLVPQNDSRTIWKLYIIVVRDRDPSFAINPINERVARIRGTNRYGTTGTGFLSLGRRGGVVRLESWGTSNLSATPTPANYATMSRDVAIVPGQWLLLSRFDPVLPPGSTPAARRVYQWYRVNEATADVIDSPPDSVAQAGVANPVPSRIVTLSGPDWTNIGPDALVFVMNNVEAVYERIIEIPAGAVPSPRPVP